MSTYFVGDIHGCYKNFRSILDYVQFNPKIDYLYLTGDLINRGPKSLEVLRFVRNLNQNFCTVLGNHDLYLLQAYFKKNNKQNCFHSILHAPDSDELINWLRRQPILHIDNQKKILMSHAGINPKWDIQQAKFYATEIEKILISDSPNLLFNYTTEININTFNSLKLQKIKNNLNFFTKMRYLNQNGQLNLQYKSKPELAPKNIYPWFNLQNRIPSEYSIIFGHWSSLKNTKIPNGFYGLDSGCCWGGHLTLLRWEDKQIIQIPCTPPT